MTFGFQDMGHALFWSPAISRNGQKLKYANCGMLGIEIGVFDAAESIPVVYIHFQQVFFGFCVLF